MQTGVSGAVDIEIMDGTYTETITLGTVPGVSATNRIKITSQSGSKSAVTFAVDCRLPGSFRINCPYVLVTDLTIHQLTYGAANTNSGVFLGADHLLLKDCEVECLDCGVNYWSGLVGAQGGNIRIKGNTLLGNGGATHGITVTDSSDPEILENEIVECQWGVSATYGNDVVTVLDNTIRECNYGIRIQGGSDHVVARNHLYGASLTAGIQVSNSDGDDLHVDINNNMISVRRMAPIYTGTIAGISIIPAANSAPTGLLSGRISHNSMVCSSDQQNVSGIHVRMTSANGLSLLSNSIKLMGTGMVGIDLVDSLCQVWPASDHNNVYRMGAGNMFGIFATHDQIAAQTGMEAHSISANPWYFSNTDLHIKDMSANINRALVDLSLSVDFDKDPRQYYDIPYDIGADEHGDLGLKSVVEMEPSLLAVEEFRAYPNPADDHVLLEPRPHGGVEVFSTTGQRIAVLSVEGMGVALGELPNGTYILRWTSDEGGHAVPIVVRH